MLGVFVESLDELKEFAKTFALPPTRALCNGGPDGLTQALPIDSGVLFNESVKPSVAFFDEACSPPLESVMARIGTSGPGNFGDPQCERRGVRPPEHVDDVPSLASHPRGSAHARQHLDGPMQLRV